MLKSLALFLVVLLCVASPARAQHGQHASLAMHVIASAGASYNENGALAMHLVASAEHLTCVELCPAGMSCLDVDCDLSVAELQASGGYGYVVFLAYNVDEVLAIEFHVVGWPLGLESPDFSGPYYCAGDSAWVAGEPFEKRGGVGGVVGFPCEEPCTGMFCFCYFEFGPAVYDWLPITLTYAPSKFSSAAFPGNRFHNCTDWLVNPVSYEHYAVIGGLGEPIPNCEPGPTGNETPSWGAIKDLYR